MSTYDPIEITRLYVFGTTTPSVDDYNEHIRPSDAQHALKTYDMFGYMVNGGGRYAYPSLFGAVEKFFNSATIQEKADKQPYTYAELIPLLGLTDKDVRLGISQKLFGNYCFKPNDST